MRRALAVAVFQVAVMLGWAGQNEYVRATAPTFRIPLQPRDPYDILRGRYFILNPRDSSIGTRDAGVALAETEVARFLGGEKSFSDVAEVGFCEAEGVFRVCRLARKGAVPSGDAARFWSRARVNVSWGTSRWQDEKLVNEPGYQVNVDLGLDRFFLPNRLVLPARENEPGWEVEVSYRPGLTPLPRRLLFRGKSVVGD